MVLGQFLCSPMLWGLIVSFSEEFVFLYQPTKLHMDEWGFSILRPFHQYYNYIGTLKGDRGDNDKGACNGASFMSLDA